MLSLRAGVVIGAGSTSYEVIRQLSTLLLVQPVPSWLEHKVQPVAASDVLRAMVEAFADDHLTGAVDLGGPNVLPYARLLAESARAAGLLRLRVPRSRCRRRWSASAPPRCAPRRSGPSTALVESLRHDMVCRPGETWVPEGRRAAARRPRGDVPRSWARSGSSPEAPLPSDPDWTRMRAPVLDELHAPATVRAGASLALRRVRSLLSLV